MKKNNNNAISTVSTQNEDKLNLLEQFGFTNRRLNSCILRRFYRCENDWERVIDVLCRRTAKFENRINNNRHCSDKKNWKLEKLEKRIKKEQEKASKAQEKAAHLAKKVEKII